MNEEYCESSGMSGESELQRAGDTKTNDGKPRHKVRSAIQRWCAVLTICVVLVEIGGYFGAWHRYFDALSHFQMQYFLAVVVLAIALVCLRRRRWAVLALLGVLWIGLRVMPWYLGSAEADGGNVDLRIMLVNVLQTNDHYADVVRQVEEVNPDVVVLQEVNQVWLDHLGRLSETRPYGIHVPGGVFRGLAIYSRIPLEDIETREFGDGTTLSVTGVLRMGEQVIHFVAAHPWPPTGEFGYESRNRQLANIADHLGQQPLPRILIGDLNVTMWSTHYHKLVRTTGLVNTRRGFGILPSFPMDSYAILRVPIDHILVSKDISVVDCRLGEPNGSDHAPLIVDLLINQD